MAADSPSQAGEEPVGFQIPVQRDFFSLVDNSDFLRETGFLGIPFEVYDGLAGEFISIPPSAYWHYTSTANPFYIVKDSRIKEQDCLDLPYYLGMLYEVTGDCPGDLEEIPSSPPLPASSPPPLSPCAEYTEQEIQTTGNEASHKWCKEAVEVASPTTKVRRTTKIEINLHIHCGKDGHSLDKGSGNSVEDPIVI